MAERKLNGGSSCIESFTWPSTQIPASAKQDNITRHPQARSRQGIRATGKHHPTFARLPFPLHPRRPQAIQSLPPLSWVRGRYAPVAQLDRALPSEGRGQGFESLRVRHFPHVRPGHIG